MNVLQISKRLLNPQTASNTYWFILKTFVNYPTVNPPSSVPEKISFETEKRLSTFEVCNDDIVKFIRSLDPNKAHGHQFIC